jgi:hypothetical protein
MIIKINKSFDTFSAFKPGKNLEIFKFNNSDNSYKPKIGVNKIAKSINFS